MDGSLSYLVGVKKAVLVTLRVFSLKEVQSGSFCSTFPFKVLSQKIMTGDAAIGTASVPLRGKKISSHTLRTGS